MCERCAGVLVPSEHLLKARRATRDHGLDSTVKLRAEGLRQRFQLHESYDDILEQSSHELPGCIELHIFSEYSTGHGIE